MVLPECDFYKKKIKRGENSPRCQRVQKYRTLYKHSIFLEKFAYFLQRVKSTVAKIKFSKLTLLIGATQNFAHHQI